MTDPLRDEDRVAQLREANEHLVLSLLESLDESETVAGQLDEMTRLAQYDTLTGTPGRALMQDRMSTALGMARRRSTRLALMFVDLDRFKQLNDRAGHAAGDAALQMAARLLQSSVRATDSVGRHGGDEFLVLLPEIARAADAARIAQKMLDALASEPLAVDGMQLPLSASIGIAIFPDDGQDLPSLIAHADAAMYSVKREGRPGGYRFHVPGMPVAGAGAGAPAASPTPSPALREANERLVVSALAEQTAADDARHRHRQQIDTLVRAAQQLREPLANLQAALADLDGVGDDPGMREQLQAQARHLVEVLTRRLQDLLGDIAAGPQGPPPPPPPPHDAASGLSRAPRSSS